MSCEVSRKRTILLPLVHAGHTCDNAGSPRVAMSSRWRSVPFAVWLSLLCVLLGVWAPAGRLLEFERTSIAGGEWWRIVTGHWVHWSPDHLFWDLCVFAVVGIHCERRSRARFLGCLLLASLLIPAAVWLALPTMATYRGLSGIDTALFTLLALLLLFEKAKQRRWGWLIAIVGLFLALAAKIGFEIAQSAALFVDVANAGFTPVPLAHVVGASVGVLVAIVPIRRPPFSSRWSDYLAK